MRVAIIVDRDPNDPEWKGAVAWNLIRALADCQHEVIVFTPLDASRIEIQHPRLMIASPAPTFAVDRLPAWLRALLTWGPEVIHTICLSPTSVWPALTVWPYLDAAFKLQPFVKRIVSLMDLSDAAAAPKWLRGANRWTVFHPDDVAKAAEIFKGPIEVCALEDQALPRFDLSRLGSNSALVPAPVSDWAEPTPNLKRLASYLIQNPSLELSICGGWGSLPAGGRREGWATLSEVAERIHMLPVQSLTEFLGHLATRPNLYTDGLKTEAWRTRLALRVAAQVGQVSLETEPAPGPTANQFSRLYLL